MKAFFAMGGYGLYVWGSFGVTAILMVAEPLQLRLRKRAAEARIRRLVRLNSNRQSGVGGEQDEGKA